MQTIGGICALQMLLSENKFVKLEWFYLVVIWVGENYVYHLSFKLLKVTLDSTST